MSIPVDVADLEGTLAGFGAGYLLSVSPNGAVKVVTVEPTVVDGGLRVVSPGRGTLTNLTGNPQVTLAFPPRQEHGFTLLVDGTGEPAGPEGTDVVVTPAGAVLHRPAAHADGPDAPLSAASAAPTGCGEDCRPVGSER